MRTTLQRTTVVGSLLAVIAASMCPAHAFAAQSTTHKKSTKSTSASHSASTANAGSSKSASTGSGKTASKSARKTSGKSSSRKNSKKVKGQAAPTTDRINEIQAALAKNGAYEGAPSGKWDDSTTDAMKKFQASHGLNPSGKLDAPTLQKLGFGSEIAGVAAPTPPANAGANRLLSSRAQQDHPDSESDQPNR
ncbi:MAG TPA: peptidoglycan-binding domain-containing protein [Candidatus Acidoferrum sp.]|jgi:peptidoglycan hydrolase-like protein with peptidoglycan-binding domain